MENCFHSYWAIIQKCQFSGVCVCAYAERKSLFFCQLPFPPNLSNHKEMWCCFFFVGADWFQTTSIKWQMWQGTPRSLKISKFTTWCGWNDTHIYPLETSPGCQDASAECEGGEFFFRWWQLKYVFLCSPRELGKVKPFLTFIFFGWGWFKPPTIFLVATKPNVSCKPGGITRNPHHVGVKPTRRKKHLHCGVHPGFNLKCKSCHPFLGHKFYWLLKGHQKLLKAWYYIVCIYVFVCTKNPVPSKVASLWGSNTPARHTGSFISPLEGPIADYWTVNKNKSIVTQSFGLVVWIPITCS